MKLQKKTIRLLYCQRGTK